MSVIEELGNICYRLYIMNKKCKTKHQGSRKVNKKIENTWTEEDLLEALHHLDYVPGSSIRGVARQFGIHEATLQFRLRKRKAGEELGKAGRKCVFDSETEKELTKCISVVCNLGFSPTMLEIIVSALF